MTVTCPLDCEFLLEARKHERVEAPKPEVLSNPDIKLTRKFLEENNRLMLFLGRALLIAALETPGAVDYDVREALETMIRTYRTLQSGVYYESVPQNALAAGIYRTVQQGLAHYRQQETSELGITKTRDSDILALLVYLHRLEAAQNNGRRRGRSFLGELQSIFEHAMPAAPPTSLILP
jgi:hypothetical protein